MNENELTRLTLIKLENIDEKIDEVVSILTRCENELETNKSCGTTMDNNEVTSIKSKLLDLSNDMKTMHKIEENKLGSM